MARVSVERAILALKAGDRVMVTHPDPTKVTDRTSYALVSGGGSLTETTFRALSSRLAPVEDGLFPQGVVPGGAQTFRLAD